MDSFESFVVDQSNPCGAVHRDVIKAEQIKMQFATTAPWEIHGTRLLHPTKPSSPVYSTFHHSSSPHGGPYRYRSPSVISVVARRIRSEDIPRCPTFLLHHYPN